MPGLLSLPEKRQSPFCLKGVRPADRVMAWHEVYGSTVAKIELEAPPADTDFMISATLRSLPGLGISETTSTETRFHKTRRLIDNDDVVLTMFDSGYSTGAQLGREAQIGAGEAILNANGEVDSGISLGRRVLLRIPKQAIASSVIDLGGKLLRGIPRENEGLLLLRQ